ncbi:MAG TPA: thioesterase family protein [Bacteriovoracaceae bacterium]|nr:thioesterase family protein [Bacteriovoracaceae bacterium]
MTSRFYSEIPVRPDDIDMFQHVHNSRYLDYIQAARYEQMGRCYQVTMEEFIILGYGWVVKKATLNFKRALIMGDVMNIYTQVQEISGSDAVIDFEIQNARSAKTSCDGQMVYTMINLKTGRSEKIPEEIKVKYLI